jgi:hypothetical protein
LTLLDSGAKKKTMLDRVRSSLRRAAFILAVAVVFAPGGARAQGGPPLLTTDAGTPGATNWEINIAAMPIFTRDQHIYQVPQLDINYGVGPRLQLTLEIPFVVATAPGRPVASGWSNALPGVKWRFIDNKRGWNVSTFPQLATGGASGDVRSGIATSGTRILLPIEVQRNFGPLELNVEAGYYVPFHEANQGHDERILGLAIGHQFTKKLEVIGETYDDSVMGVPPHDTTWDAGARYEFHRGLIWLAMAGRSFSAASSGQPTFLGYFGIQILLDHNGRSLHVDQ